MCKICCLAYLLFNIILKNGQEPPLFGMSRSGSRTTAPPTKVELLLIKVNGCKLLLLFTKSFILCTAGVLVLPLKRIDELSFFFNWDSLYTRLNNHYKAWMELQEKKH